MNLSIIIPIYNVEPYIGECLQSVVNQTMTEGVECILVDDCGSDSSIAIAESFINSYKGDIKFSLIHHDKNRGLSAARNSGIKVANGEYLYFLDSDDELTTDTIEVMYKFVKEHPKVDIVQGGFFNKKDDAGKPTPYFLPEYTEDIYLIKTTLLTFDGDLIKAQSRLVRRDFFVENNLWFKEGIIHEDNYWTFFLAKCVRSMCFCNKRTYYHRMNPNSITHAINVKKEYNAYKVILEDFCNSIDAFLSGHQKELILETLIVALNRGCVYTEKERRYLINIVNRQNNIIEYLLLYIYLKTKNSHILHLLIRLYKIKD